MANIRIADLLDPANKFQPMTKQIETTITFGKINLSNAMFSVAAWRISAPFKRESAITTGKKQVGTARWVDATRHRKIGGSFGTERVLHPEGTIIAFQTTRTRNKIRIADATVFLRLRSGAAFIGIQAKLPVGPESLLGDRLMIFQGNADIMTAAELRVCGIEIARNYERSYMDPEEFDENLEILTITPATTPRPEFRQVVSEGEVVVKAMAADPVRRIGRLRRSA